MEPVQLWSAQTDRSADKTLTNDEQSRNLPAQGLKETLRVLDRSAQDDVFTQLIWNWPFALERRLVYAAIITVNSCTGVSALAIGHVLRKEFLLGRLARIQGAVTAYALSTMFSTIGHYYLVFRPMVTTLASESGSVSSLCPVCLELRQLAINTVCGIAFPMVTGPLSCLFIVSYCDLYNLPRMRNFSRWSRFVWSKIRPVGSILPWLLVANAAFSTVCVYGEYKLSTRIIDAAQADPEIFLHLSTHKVARSTFGYWLSRLLSLPTRKKNS
ncbi:unnamed protein product [Soboliphyme baturini]|uniref:Rhomboid domain-containing protein n=1 Tax=Soboliphyme baturini TaxID=241478 RepID=A0A183IVE2_9BILA|nr:unnamed protein product [Soboliphyme baturini]